MLKRLIIRKMRKVPSLYRKLFIYQTYREYQILVKQHKYKITKQEKKEIRAYWKKYFKNVSLYPHTLYYNLTGIKDVRFIPDYIYHGYIDYYFNNLKYNSAFEDKNYFDLLFKDFKRPVSVIHNIAGEFYDKDYHLITRENALKMVKDRIKEKGELIIKASVESSSGNNIYFINKDSNLENIFNIYNNKNFIVQEVIKQHKDMAKMHKDSINTIRTASLLWHGKVYILSSIVRIGQGETRLDNSHQGGLHVGVDEKGNLREVAYDKEANEFKKHPQGFVFKGAKIPNYDKVIEEVKRAQERFGHFKLIHWDFAIGEDGEPIFIEYNVGFGGIYVHQEANGPFFGDLTEEVLDEVFSDIKHNIKL